MILMKNMRKSFYTFFLCLLFFSVSSLATEMSDDEKRSFIESLAKPSFKKQIFYRWLSESEQQEFLKAGEMTVELYKHHMKKKYETKQPFGVGQGLYVAEDANSSAVFGKTIIKVEVEKDYPFIDLNDKRVQRQLQKKGIGLKEAYLLNPRVAVKDKENPKWWCLKRLKGISFKPISNQELIKHFKEAPFRETHSFEKKQFFNLLPTQEQKRLISEIENLLDGMILLFVAGKHFSETELTEIVNATIPYIKDMRDGMFFLNMGLIYLSEEDIDKIVSKSFSHATEEDIKALSQKINTDNVLPYYSEDVPLNSGLKKVQVSIPFPKDTLNIYKILPSIIEEKNPFKNTLNYDKIKCYEIFNKFASSKESMSQ